MLSIKHQFKEILMQFKFVFKSKKSLKLRQYHKKISKLLPWKTEKQYDQTK